MLELELSSYSEQNSGPDQGLIHKRLIATRPQGFLPNVDI